MTSHQAAASASAGAGRIRQAVLAALVAEEDGLTDEQLVQALTHVPEHRAWSASGIRSRRAELAQVNPPLVVDSGRRGRTERGRATIVWVATEAGRAAG